MCIRDRVSSASPYKFTRDVVQAILGEKEVGEKDDFALNEILTQVSGMPVPAGLQGLKGKPILHTVSDVYKRQERGMLSSLMMTTGICMS